jgi:tetratricopeptide (TPR) repeat protein
VAMVGCGNWRARKAGERAQAAIDNNDPAAALALYEQALEDARQTKNNGYQGHVLLRMGGIHQRQGRFDQAQQLYEEALAAYKEAKDKNGEAAVIHEMGALHMAKGQYPEAERFLLEALRMRKHIGDEEGIAATENELGSIHLRMDRPQDAKAEYELALGIRRRLGNQRQIAETLHNLGAVYHAELRDQFVYTGDQPQLWPEEKDKDWFEYRYQMALDYYSESLTLFERIGDRWWIAQLHYQLGCLHIVHRYCDLAREELEKALTIHDGLRSKADPTGVDPLLGGAKGEYAFLVDVGWIYHSMGSSYHVEGRLREALDWYHRALPVWERLKDRTATSATEHEIGGVYQLMHNVPEAIRWYKLALRIREDELHDNHMAAYTYYEMGNTYGGGPLAVLCWKAALERAELPEIRDIHLESGCRKRLGLPERDHSKDRLEPLRRTATDYEYSITESQVLREIELAPESMGGGRESEPVVAAG